MKKEILFDYLGALMMAVIVGFGVLMIIIDHIPHGVKTIATRTTTVSDTSGAIGRAKIASDGATVTYLEGGLLGLDCLGSKTVFCDDLVGRADKNPLLKSALLKAKAMDVMIFPSGDAEYEGRGLVVVNTRSSDEEIIAFLTK